MTRARVSTGRFRGLVTRPRTRPLARLFALLPFAAFTVGSAPPSRTERWTALSTTAMSITGDILLSPSRLIAAGRVIRLTVAADLPAFGTLGGTTAPARVLKVISTPEPRLLRGNRLCDGRLRWIAVYRGDRGRVLNLAAFSSGRMPAGEHDPALCGTFTYTR